MTDVATPDVKGRCLSTADSSPQGVTCLSDLPSGILALAASYLAAPSRALFAVALDENSAVLPNERSSAIVGNQWDTLDFGEIEKELAAKLSDSDIKEVLLCMDAFNKLKRLKLTNCTNIIGAGLMPLRGSVVIEQIDFSVAGEHQNSDLEPPISPDIVVLFILDSIIAREGCALKHLQFPSMWREEPSADSEFHAFIVRYDEMRRNQRTVRCLECNRSLPRDGHKWIGTYTEEDYHYYGIHWNTCYGCLKHYCYGCDIDGDPEGDMLKECDTCRRDYCRGCSEMTECSGCESYICNDCCDYKCVECDEDLFFCPKCVERGESARICDYCDKCYCRECYYEVYDNDGENVVEISTCSLCDVEIRELKLLISKRVAR